MGLAFILALLMAAGVFLISLGVAWPSLAAQRGLRRQIQTYLARPIGQAEQARPDEPVSLRRAEGVITAGFLADLVPKPPSDAREARKLALVRLALMAVAMGLGTIALLVTGRWWALLLGLGAPLGIWVIYLRMRRSKRVEQINETVPEALDILVRALRIGQPVGVALQSAAKDLVGPLAEEFAIAAERISYGQGAGEALRDMAERAENQNLRFLAAAVSIQSTTGGNLADVLERLSVVARSRLAMRRKINAITAEAKWSGRFLSAFPLLATGGLLIVNPNFYEGVSDQDFFRPLMAGVAVLLVFNVMFMRWLGKLE